MVGPGDQIMVDGQVIGQGQIDVDESLLSGESKLIPKQAEDKVYSGSFCVTGRAVYEVQKVGADSFANELTTSARVFTREYTPLQREVDLIVRVLLGVVIFFGIVLLINFILENANFLDTVRAVSVVFGIAPSSLFLMIVVAYALGAVRIADKGALVQQINSVESLCHVTVLCLDKTGTLTTNRIQLDQIKPINGSSGLAESELRHILGDYAYSVSASNRRHPLELFEQFMKSGSKTQTFIHRWTEEVHSRFFVSGHHGRIPTHRQWKPSSDDLLSLSAVQAARRTPWPSVKRRCTSHPARFPQSDAWRVRVIGLSLFDRIFHPAQTLLQKIRCA